MRISFFFPLPWFLKKDGGGEHHLAIAHHEHQID